MDPDFEVVQCGQDSLAGGLREEMAQQLHTAMPGDIVGAGAGGTAGLFPQKRPYSGSIVSGDLEEDLNIFTAKVASSLMPGGLTPGGLTPGELEENLDFFDAKAASSLKTGASGAADAAANATVAAEHTDLEVNRSPIHLDRFCSLLQQHAEGSDSGKQGNCAMLFGSTGAGKSTTLHMLAGSKFTLEAVELETDEAVVGEFGNDTELQLVTQTPIPGVDIGNSSSSQTLLLHSYSDQRTDLIYIDTPGFNNVGDNEGNDITVDAANSAAIMSAIRSCNTLRIVFLINVKDELNTTKAGQIKKLFGVMDKFIRDASTRMHSVLMLFTHCDGFPTHTCVIKLLNKIGRSNVLPDNLKPFLLQALELLKIHGDDLLVKPAEENAQIRMDVVRNLLKNTMVPIADTEAALQCPLSEEVQLSLGLACAQENEKIINSLHQNGLLTDTLGPLKNLRLLNDALRLPNVKLSYTSALHAIKTLADERTQRARAALDKQSFSEVHNFLSIFKCTNLSILSEYMAYIGDESALVNFAKKSRGDINNTCTRYLTELDAALFMDDFDSAVEVLARCKELLKHLGTFMPAKMKEMAAGGAIGKVVAQMNRNNEKARVLIDDKCFESKLASLLNIIRHSSEHCLLQQLIDNAGDDYYAKLTAQLETEVIFIADGLTNSLMDASHAFLVEVSSTDDALVKIQDAQIYLGEQHLGNLAKTKCSECREAFTVLKDQTFQRLKNSITERTWEDAAHFFRCLKAAESLGLDHERHNVESRLLDIQDVASSLLGELVKALDSEQTQNDFHGFVGHACSLGNAVLVLTNCVLSDTSLHRFKREHERLLSEINCKFDQTLLQCQNGLKQHQHKETVDGITVLQEMAHASVGTATRGWSAVMDFDSRIVTLLQDVHDFAENECNDCKHVVDKLNLAAHPDKSEVAELLVYLQHVQQHKKMFCELTGKIPSLCERMQANGLHQNLAWDVCLFERCQAVEVELGNSLRRYAVECHERCMCSLATEPKPRTDDVAAFLKTLATCQDLEPFFSAGQGQKPPPFTEQRQAVVDFVKLMFSELRHTFSLDLGAVRMADANAKLEKAKEMLVLREVFAADAITLDTAVEEMRGNFDQKSSLFAHNVADALQQERFNELNTLLLGYRDLPSAADQEEYNKALNRVKEAGDSKYNAAMQFISSIGEDVRGELPAYVRQIATDLRWIEGASCLSEGGAPILPHGIYTKWQSAFYFMKSKLELLKARASKLDEWKFTTVELIYRRLHEMTSLQFPAEIAQTIVTINQALRAALEAKVDGLDVDVRKALDERDPLTIDLIFQEVKTAKDADNHFVNNVKYNHLMKVLELFLEDLVMSIKKLYMKFEIKEAQVKQKHLWHLERAAVAKNYVSRAGLDELAESQQKKMIKRLWLSEGDICVVMSKVNGFRDSDPVKYEMLVREFMETFDADIKRLRRVETKTDVDEVGKVVLQMPRFATILDSEKPLFAKCWDEIWNSFFESVHQKLRNTVAASGQEQQADISDCISFLQAARKLFQTILGVSNADLRIRADSVSFSPALFILPLPFENEKVLELIAKLDGLLGHLDVDASEIDADWKQYIDAFDFTKEGQSFANVLHFIRQLKRLAPAIRASGKYGLANTVPSATRAISRLRTTASSQVAALDVSKPEDGAVVSRNLEQFFNDCMDVVDDDNELQTELCKNMLEHKDAAKQWIVDTERDMAKKITECYANARKQNGPAERKAMLREVTTSIDLHERLQEKLVSLAMKVDTGAELPLVVQLKKEISEEVASTRQLLYGGCSVEQIAETIHGMYITATDLDNAAILMHAEACISQILEAVAARTRRNIPGPNMFGLQDLGSFLENNVPQGPEIVANMPHFKELSRQAYQKSTTGMSLEGTVKEVRLLNNLSEDQTALLLDVVRKVYNKYSTIVQKYRLHPGDAVQEIQREYNNSHNLPDLIGGVFSIWSLKSITEYCGTCDEPHITQIVAIVRLLVLDKPPPKKSTLNHAWSELQSWFHSPAESPTRIDASHLAQIKTGQGKSVVLGVLATVLSIIGFKVDCVCYSSYLSERDNADFKMVFDLFGVSKMVEYSTFQQLCERLVNSDGNVRELTQSILNADNVASGGDVHLAPMAAQAAAAEGGWKGSSIPPRVPRPGRVKSPQDVGGSAARSNTNVVKDKRVLLIDEVDVFFSSSFYGETYDLVLPLKLDKVADLQKKAWSMMLKGVEIKSILPSLKITDAYCDLSHEFSHIKNILDGQIAKMCNDLAAWKNSETRLDQPFRDYKVIEDRIAYKTSVGSYDSKISFGYVTLWTYFEEVKLQHVSGAALEEHLGLIIDCGQFSYAEIPKRYQLILGVTGTLMPEIKNGAQPLGRFEQDIIRQDYKIKGQTELPSVFGERNLSFQENLHVNVTKDEEDFNNAIEQEVAKANDGRAILVFFETEARLRAWKDSDYGQRVPVGTMDIINSDTRKDNVSMKVRKATTTGNITLLTREHGRGLDFICHDKIVEQNGGLHVVQTFLSEELSEEIQIKGRTARGKNKGSFQIILLISDLEKFGITAEEIKLKQKGIFVPVQPMGTECALCFDEQKHPESLPCGHSFCSGCVTKLHEDTNSKCPLCSAPASTTAASAKLSVQTLYDFLHDKRSAFLEKSSETRREAVVCAKVLHDQTLTFQAELATLAQNPKLTQSKEKCLNFLDGRNAMQTKKCRLMCLSDATGSMGGVWKQTQSSIRIMLERISAISGGSGNIEVKWVAFRDYELQKSLVLEASLWTDDPTSLVKFVGGIKCISHHGCDGPEAVEAALNCVNNELEPPTRVLLIGDAPPHHEGKGNKLKKLIVHASNKEPGAFVAGGVLMTDYREECAHLKRKDIKVYPLYLNERAQATFDEIAEMTGGESKSLDASNEESLIHAICETALEDIGGIALQDQYRAQYRK